MALLVSLLVSGLFTFWLSRRVAKAARATVPQKQFMVAASQALEAGELLKPESLRLVELALCAHPLREGSPKSMTLRAVSCSFRCSRASLFSVRHLAGGGMGGGLTAKIPSGMRAISVRSDEVVGVAGFLLPGTHVDVLMTFHSR